MRLFWLLNEKCNESKSNAKKILNIWMYMQLVGHYHKFPVKDNVGDSYTKFVGQFHWYFQWRFCNMHLHSCCLQMCVHFNPNSVMYLRYTFVRCCAIYLYITKINDPEIHGKNKFGECKHTAFFRAVHDLIRE